MTDIQELMNKAVQFHGHTCPGVALGVLVSKYILEHGNEFSIDEELVAVVENDNCSVDALQTLLGTTFGKGNLIFKDYGKNNYAFYNRTKETAVKLIMKGEKYRDQQLTREDRIEKLLSSPPEEIFEIREIEYNPPSKAQIHESVNCGNCRQPTMSTRIKTFKGKELCIPCYEKFQKKEKG
ncbi:MAG: FmdE family protein [Promethearchaeia archaeon]